MRNELFFFRRWILPFFLNFYRLRNSLLRQVELLFWCRLYKKQHSIGRFHFVSEFQLFGWNSIFISTLWTKYVTVKWIKSMKFCWFFFLYFWEFVVCCHRQAGAFLRKQQNKYHLQELFRFHFTTYFLFPFHFAFCILHFELQMPRVFHQTSERFIECLRVR